MGSSRNKHSLRNITIEEQETNIVQENVTIDLFHNSVILV